jgi:2-methylcitrate dehydratase PrpD
MNDARNTTARELTRLSEWITAVRLDDIPRPIVERAVRVLADDLSAIIGARDEPEVAAFNARTISASYSNEATVFCGGRARTDRRNAAVANGLAADWLELDEGYRVTPCHAGLYVVPALLAEAEASQLGFDRMLRALVLGYEFVTRIARSWSPGGLTMQSHGRYGAIGAAAAVALARGTDARLFLDAVCTAATLIGPSPRTHLIDGTLARNVWPAAGAWNGFMAFEWAECGIAGAPTAFYDVFTTVLGGEAHPERLLEGLTGSGGAALNARWSLEDGYTKIYACCQHVHSAVEAALDLRAALLRDSTLEEIESVTVHTHALAVPLMNTQPHTTLGAKFSMPHSVAAALVTGSGGADAFSAATLTHDVIGKLRERIRTAPYTPTLPPPNDRPARISIALKSGRTIAGECLSAKGGPDRPLPPDTVFDKLDALAVPKYPLIRNIFEDLTALSPARLAQGWHSIVNELTTSKKL